MEDQLRIIGQYKNQDVYLDIPNRQVSIEKDHKYLVTPNTEERKGLIDEGLIKIVNRILEEKERR